MVDEYCLSSIVPVIVNWVSENKNECFKVSSLKRVGGDNDFISLFKLSVRISVFFFKPP